MASNNTFPLFSRLPPGIQRTIWEIAVDDDESIEMHPVLTDRLYHIRGREQEDDIYCHQIRLFATMPYLRGRLSRVAAASLSVLNARSARSAGRFLSFREEAHVQLAPILRQMNYIWISEHRIHDCSRTLPQLSVIRFVHDPEATVQHQVNELRVLLYGIYDLPPHGPRNKAPPTQPVFFNNSVMDVLFVTDRRKHHPVLFHTDSKTPSVFVTYGRLAAGLDWFRQVFWTECEY